MAYICIHSPIFSSAHISIHSLIHVFIHSFIHSPFFDPRRETTPESPRRLSLPPSLLPASKKCSPSSPKHFSTPENKSGLRPLLIPVSAWRTETASRTTARVDERLLLHVGFAPLLIKPFRPTSVDVTFGLFVHCRESRVGSVRPSVRR